ncbi:MAG: cob(I)yrinic acid a,c-diamide adenosyltransferase [Dehalococcoidia bacterium]|nr:cob(I)yrinic acid a,c-diamide adenosyltransferase [Dehalococcoidia bacterium]MYH67188.1 cob(I)yrinic acid a,c-diamide adenosyltransferase [Dehalococcoidia bacterium]MYI86911.1 cob(I)yrinic acid a,c-diamide adenosyltransferase [Dehalococcoidia bacterium]
MPPDDDRVGGPTPEEGEQQADGRRRVKHGLVVVNTGEGKGKTTAALGVLFRAWGRDFRVRMFQFIKHSTARFGEHRAAKKLDIRIEAMGDGFTWLSKDMDRTTALAVAQWERCREAILEGGEDVIILDEFTYAMHYGWVPVEEVLDTLRRRPEGMHVIITGRYAPEELVEFADLVTEMKLVKHPYQEQGIRAQPGLEY